MSRRAAFWVAGGAFTALAIVAAIVFQDALTRSLLNPSTPFQVSSPPPAPDYAARGAWLVWPDRESGTAEADIFYIHSTTYYSSESWNAPIDDASADAAARRAAAPNEVGPFFGLGRIYAPRYRQATLFAFFTHKYDGVAARRLAYRDVRRAFEAFLKTSGAERPIILVGYGQGGLHALGLLQDYFQGDEALRRRLAAAYVLRQAVPLSLFDAQLARTPPCTEPDQARCVVSYTDFEKPFDEEMRRTRDRSMVWTPEGDLIATKGEPLLCVNPIAGRRTREHVGPAQHVGAASATGLRLGETPPPVARAIGAQCVDGVLVVDRPRQDFLRRSGWFGAKWRVQHFNLFYFDLAEDAKRRLAVLKERLEREARYLDPIEQAVEIETSPVNKVPSPE
ncbi:DUF3089 domain-containing protein [Amphiplicatus metriothermophilus]|uniref:DUF3089 domain-containing protein n=1 Tax=Amphiplicatus metriothermophilus TaxID=1519374 RepID=A0A239PPH8_9PROT|nr:DUF3089 domain-containing protein [Amphiplicatus metriothermophilus]MBB5518638.1 hypothetical protein [Amphiplicatus metriothermophilus]SNT72204.1 Protein of unknown function [Amphiplicatus metriothermophilus]